ncbi:YbaY family lipoprotein [Ovoidimarina sediminis]|uniref:YbaY family lipoprotein n=1 Tax=Ovoidimarina sediminis TaxID=3079856 RepID=UPI0029105511|nr:YbaY family lipoprotein [Rhodophyticola sp. MJ-SS7]MDU8944291.1 YbaY family lipoprotein [Rhodophyticola sp. MJ-SS7]
MRTEVGVAALLVALLPFASTGLAETMHLDTTVTYRERIALPPDAVLEVELLDTSRADAPSVRLSSQRFKLAGVPRTVEIAYDTNLIEERLTYTVAAKIISDGNVMFRSTTATPVLTRGAPRSTEIVLEMMPQRTGSSSPNQSIKGITWAAYEIAGRMLIADDPPTLSIDQNGQFALYGGCNRFTGTVDASDGEFSMPDNIAGTSRACPEERERLERDTLDALSTVTGYLRSGSNLALTNDAGVTVLRFREMPE